MSLCITQVKLNVIRTAVSEGNVWERGRALFSSTADSAFLFLNFLNSWGLKSFAVLGLWNSDKEAK